MKLTDPTHGLRGTDLEAVALKGDSLDDYKEFWDQSAKVDSLKAISDQDDEESFEVSGKVDAESIAHLLTPDSVVLEVGCGTGRVLQHLSPLAGEVHGVDISSEMCEQGRARLSHLDNVTFHNGNGYDLAEFEDNTFDLVYSVVAFQHMPKTIVFNYLTEIKRTLKSGGLLRFVVPNMLRDDHFHAFTHFAQPYFVENPYPMNFYTPAELARMLTAAGLHVDWMNDYIAAQASKDPVAPAPADLSVAQDETVEAYACEHCDQCRDHSRALLAENERLRKTHMGLTGTVEKARRTSVGRAAEAQLRALRNRLR